MHQYKHVGDVVELPCTAVKPSKKQQRETSRQEGIDSLVESILAKGQVQPALVRPVMGTDEDVYELISGERRWRACTALGRPLKAIILGVDGTEEQFALSCIANNQQALTPMEICSSLHVLYASKEMQHVKKEKRMEATARRYFGRGHQWAWGYWGLYRLDARLQPLVRRNCPIGAFLPLKIAVRLAGLPLDVPGIQVRVWEEIIAVDPAMTVRDAQQHITDVKNALAVAGKKSRGRPPAKPRLALKHYLEKTLRSMEPMLELVGEEEFTLQLKACNWHIRKQLDDDLSGIIERMEMMRDMVRRADRTRTQNVP